MTCFAGDDFLTRVYAFHWNNTPDTKYVYAELEATNQVQDKSVRVTHKLFFCALKVRGNLWEAAGRLGFDCFCGALDKSFSGGQREATRLGFQSHDLFRRLVSTLPESPSHPVPSRCRTLSGFHGGKTLRASAPL